ncbi:MAG: L,D-transpeptidase [Salinarimonadaceae bacterium]|nr:MAG: L,D-transpeptidase [Salinarimonadaceae bacterium]
MRSIGSSLACALLAAGLAFGAGASSASAQSGVRYAEPGAPSPNLGGGFIELLLTGRDPTPRTHAAPPPVEQRRGRPGQSQEVIPAVIPAEIPAGRRVSAPVQQRTAALAQPGAPRSSITQGHAIDPRFRRQVVAYEGREAPGTIVVDTRSRFLYFVQEGGKAVRYGVGVGREGFSWRGSQRVTRKAEWPDWRPPEAMRRRQPELPAFMAGGPDNPLGARALYLGNTLYRIHGTNEPHTIGQAMSSGCIRMMNEDVIDLYQRVRVGARVVVL